MSELKIGQKINLTIGESVKIVKELGRGGQGIVYEVNYREQPFALKWYTQEFKDSSAFYNNLRTNIESGAPSKVFLWPEMLTENQEGSFGYIMKLRPSGFYDFTDFLLAKKTFSSMDAIIKSVMNICSGFKALHIRGLSYLDLNDGNFFVNPLTGDILICDNDNVTAQGNDLGMSGKMRYMAPEIVLGKNPDKYSDYYSLAVILFLFFYANHPLEGKRVLSCPCMTEDNERKHYGSNALFIFDKQNNENSPVRGVHGNAIRRWPLFSKVLQTKFIDAFSQDRIKNPTNRFMESEWIDIFSKLRNRLVVCPNCGGDFFVSNDSDICINCGKSINLRYSLKTNKYGRLALFPKKQIYFGNSEIPIAVVRVNKKDPSILGLQNISTITWTVETPSGKLKPVAPNEIMPTKTGLKIKFNQNDSGEIL